MTVYNTIVELNTVGRRGANIQGTWLGANNLIDTGSPGFVANPTRYVFGDLRLAADSPAIDAGDNARLPADWYDLDADGNVAEALPLDVAGDSRVVDGDGNGLATVDIGAYERAALFTALADGNQAFDLADYLALQGTAESGSAAVEPVDHVLRAADDLFHSASGY